MTFEGANRLPVYTGRGVAKLRNGQLGAGIEDPLRVRFKHLGAFYQPLGADDDAEDNVPLNLLGAGEAGVVGRDAGDRTGGFVHRVFPKDEGSVLRVFVERL